MIPLSRVLFQVGYGIWFTAQGFDILSARETKAAHGTLRLFERAGYDFAMSLFKRFGPDLSLFKRLNTWRIAVVVNSSRCE